MSQGYYQETGYMSVLLDVPAANETKRIVFSVHYLKGTTLRGKCSSRLTKCSHCKKKREREKKRSKNSGSSLLLLELMCYVIAFFNFLNYELVNN